MGKNGASRNYTNRTYAVHSRTKTYQDPRYGKSFALGQRSESTRSKSSRLLKITTK